MSDLIRKLSSRKLWVAIAGITTGIALSLGADGNEIVAITGNITAVLSGIIYIITEGRVDAARVSTPVVEVIEDELEN